MAAESGSWKNGARSERNDEEVVITRVSPPPSKRSKIDDDEDVVYVDREEPLRCSTPQLEASCKELPGDDLDATLEELGISHDSIGESVPFHCWHCKAAADLLNLYTSLVVSGIPFRCFY